MPAGRVREWGEPAQPLLHTSGSAIFQFDEMLNDVGRVDPINADVFGQLNRYGVGLQDIPASWLIEVDRTAPPAFPPQLKHHPRPRSRPPSEQGLPLPHLSRPYGSGEGGT